MWYHTEIIALNKYNYVADYNMDDDTIYNGGGHIPFDIIMTRRMVDIDEIKSDVSVEAI